MTTETDIALIAQRLELHIEQCTELGRQTREALEKMHAENRENLEKLLAAQAKMSSAFDQAKGGWKMVFAASSLIAGIAGAAAWLFSHVTVKP
jgi:anti-sigma-K factor RskA